eukprot:gene13101-27657_t
MAAKVNSNEYYQGLWNLLLDCDIAIRHDRGETRLQRINFGLNMTERIIRENPDFFFAQENFDRLSEFYWLHSKLCSYLDDVDAYIQLAVGGYFSKLYSNDKEDILLQFGVQVGCTCSVTRMDIVTRYFVKAHQDGPMKPLSGPGDVSRGTNLVNKLEPFMYKVLELIGMGPEVHFIVPKHGSKMTLFIATKYCNLIMLQDLTSDTANTRALLQLDLLSRILELRLHH